MNTEQLSPAKKTIVGVQFLFVAFGATVLVPLLIGINPATALFTAGVGTLIFHVVTKGRVPIFLGSSFAFIAPIIAATQQWGLPGTIAGLTSVSLVYFVMSALVKWQGRKLLDRLFPPVVIGPVIILIGLSLSGSAVNMAKDHWLLAFVSLITAILVLTLCRGLMKLVPILSGVAVGYIVAVCMGEVDFTGVANASWIAMPVAFDTITHFSWSPFLYMMPVAIAPVIMSITKVTSPAVIRISALTAICFSVVGKLSALLQSIPQAVLGGIMLLLFGTIASVGVQNLMQHRVDMNDTRNVIIISVMLTMGLGGAVLSGGSFAISGIGLSAVIGVVLNLVLPKTKAEEK